MRFVPLSHWRASGPDRAMAAGVSSTRLRRNRAVAMMGRLDCCSICTNPPICGRARARAHRRCVPSALGRRVATSSLLVRSRPAGPDGDRSARAWRRGRRMLLLFACRHVGISTEHWAVRTSTPIRVASTSPLTTYIGAPADRPGPEAGCGLGQYVILLRQRIAVIGADWSHEALHRSRRAAPSTPLAVMDLTGLAVKSGALPPTSRSVSWSTMSKGPTRSSPRRRVCWRQGQAALSAVLERHAATADAAAGPRGDRIRASGGTFYQFAFRRKQFARSSRRTASGDRVSPVRSGADAEEGWRTGCRAWPRRRRRRGSR